MKLLFFFIYTFLMAFLFAKWEIQIEGKYGWAAKLPTWRKNSGFLVKIYGKPITGYHVYMFLTSSALVHFPIFFITNWTLKNELTVLGFLLLMLVFEDFLWFVLNPAFGLKNFRKTNPNLWWHKKWFLGLPLLYWFFLPIGIVLILIGY